MNSVALLGRVNLVQQWRTDFLTARSDLEATGAQAFLVAANALAWRASALFTPAALIVAVVLVLQGGTGQVAFLLAAPLGVLGPQMLVFLVTFPVGFFAVAQAWSRGSRDARIRFSGLGGLGFKHYGWRYAYRGRTRPWGALSAAEKVAVNPVRAGHAADGTEHRAR